ncbi:MAG: hypothetical protein HY294_06860 [Candidatus Rokubacteria bacterium]|nr:hypothetical protein [Candidatus Rokubacteria bacterium]
MDVNEYALQVLVHDRLAAARRDARRRALLGARPRARPLRVRLATALIAVGHRVLAGSAPAPAPHVTRG